MEQEADLRRPSLWTPPSLRSKQEPILLQEQDLLTRGLAASAVGASFLAAAAPALCAVHCAAMPVVTVLLPSLSLSSKFLGGTCMHGVARKLAIYFVAPFGILANALTYPQHKNEMVAVGSMTGVTSVVLAATCPPLKTYRNFLNFGGCGLMLGFNYYGNQLAKDRGHACDCRHCH